MFLVGCNNQKISSSSEKTNNNTTTVQSNSTGESKSSIVPISNNSNYIAPIPKTNTEYLKKDINAKDINASAIWGFDDTRFITLISYDLASSQTVYNNDGTIFIDGNIKSNEFSDKPNTLNISKAYDNYTIVQSTVATQNNDGFYFTDIDSETHFYLYNIKNREKTEIENIDYAKLEGKYIITDKGILDTNLNNILPTNDECEYKEINNNELIIAQNINNKKFGLLNLKGEVIADFIYSNIYSFNGGTDIGGIGSSHASSTHHPLDNINNFVEYTIATKPFTDNNGDEFGTPIIIDTKGKEIKTPFLMDISIIRDSRFISQYNGKTYFTFCEGPPEYIKGWSELPKSKSSNYFILDENGETVLDDFTSTSGFINGYCLVASKETMKTKLVNLDGDTIYEISKYETPDDAVSYISVPDSKGLFVVFENGTHTIYDLAKNKIYSSNSYILALGNGVFYENGFDENDNPTKNYFTITAVT